jgi:hypothetical protein
MIALSQGEQLALVRGMVPEFDSMRSTDKSAWMRIAVDGWEALERFRLGARCERCGSPAKPHDLCALCDECVRDVTEDL